MAQRFDKLRAFLSPEKVAAMVKGAAAPYTDITYPLTNPIAQGLETAGEDLNKVTQESALNVLNEPTPSFIPGALRQPIEDLKTVGKGTIPSVLDALKLTPSNLAGQIGMTVAGGAGGAYLMPKIARLAAKGSTMLPDKLVDTLLTNVEDLPGVRGLVAGPKPIPEMPLAPKQKFYRGGGSPEKVRGKTAQDVVDFEREELGNADVIPEAGIDLKSIAIEKAAQRAQVSLESSPGPKTKFIPEELTAPAPQRKAFHDEMNKIFYDEAGNDILAAQTGLARPQHLDAPGFYKGKMSPGSQEVFPPGTDIKKMKDYAAKRGLILKQESMGTDNPLYAKSIKDADLADVILGRKPLDKEVESLYNLLGNDDFNIIATPDGMHVRNFSGFGKSPVENRKFINTVKAAVENITPQSEKFTIKAVKHGGDLIEGGQNGKMYIDQLSNTEGLPSVARTERLFGPRVAKVHEEIAKKFGWTNPYKYEGPSSTIDFLTSDSPLIRNIPASSGEASALTLPRLTQNKNNQNDINAALRAGISRFR